MYSRAIDLAEQTLADNERVRMESAELQAQVRDVMLTYRRHHFPQLSGASDAGDAALPQLTATDITEKILNKFRSGLLPLPRNAPEKCYVGKGTRRPCDGCDGLITLDEIEYELDLSETCTVRFHDACLALWHTARAERMAE